MDQVTVRLDKLTKRELYLHTISLLAQQGRVLNRLDRFMADLATSVETLKDAVDTMAVRFASQTVPLTEALATAQEALDALQDVSDADKAALTEALAAASSAAEAIDAEVVELNSIGAAPDVPVEPVPVEELPAPPSEEPPTETPAEPVAPDGPVETEADPAAPTDAPTDPATEADLPPRGDNT